MAKTKAVKRKQGTKKRASDKSPSLYLCRDEAPGLRLNNALTYQLVLGRPRRRKKFGERFWVGKTLTDEIIDSIVDEELRLSRDGGPIRVKLVKA